MTRAIGATINVRTPQLMSMHAAVKTRKTTTSNPSFTIGTRVEGPELSSPEAIALMNARPSFWLSANPSSQGSSVGIIIMRSTLDFGSSSE
jgi:hypothetical protein